MAVELNQTVPPRLEDRFKLVLEMATESDVLSDAMKDELKALLDPTNLAMIVGVLVVWAGSHAFGIGLIFDAILLGASIFMVGWSAWEAAQQIAEFMEKTISAKTMNDLKIASTLLATAIAILSVKLFMRIVSKGAAGATSGGKSRKSSIREKVEEPPKPQPRARASTPPPKPERKFSNTIGEQMAHKNSQNRGKLNTKPKAKQKYVYDTKPGLDTGQPILFGQKGVSPDFSKAGKFKGKDIEAVAEDLRSGKLKASDIEVQYIWVNGQKVVVNNRSLTVLTMAGKKPVNVKDMTGKLGPDKLPDGTDNPDSLNSVLKRLDEMDGKPSTSSKVRSSSDRDAPIKRTVELEDDQ